jgi:hypothetical protein
LRLRLKPWLLLLSIAVLVAVVAYIVARREKGRFIRSDADMVGLLPQRDMTTVFLNADVLRRAKLLGLLQASVAGQDGDYQQFVRDTGFDYARDIDVLAARGDARQIFFVIRGKFEWARLQDYAARHGGNCSTAFCKVPTTRAGRWASYLRIQSDVIGLAVSNDPADVLLLSPRPIENAPALPSEPVWVSLGHSLLSDNKDLPLPVRIFAVAVQSADSVTLSMGARGQGSGNFELRLRAVCQNAAVANTIRNQLEIDTKMLRLELERERQRPSRSDLTGLLSAGAFSQAGNSVVGVWPVYSELVNSFQ